MSFWRGRSVFLTGHTGFKGGWLALWLSQLGANVHGYSLLPPTRPSFFEETKFHARVASSTIGDIRDLKNLSQAMRDANPSVVIHMAAQPLVRESYNSPADTFATNVLGTVNLLEASRGVQAVKAIVNITTDKCYENQEWVWPYRENDRLGGHDPYSSSKACAEFVTAAYRSSFFSAAGIHLATVRAGNVIGGGDFSDSRWKVEGETQPYEASLLKLDSSKAKSKLGWRPRWSLETALQKTVDWHQAWRQGGPMSDFSLQQIEAYQAA